MSLIIWINKNEAKLFHLTEEGVVKSKVHQHTQHQDHSVDEKKFFAELSTALKNIESKEWYLIGPGVCKDHFQNYLKEHHSPLFERIRGVAKKDFMTDNEIIQDGTHFFRHAHVFNAI